jgi:hypothetical protein
MGPDGGARLAAGGDCTPGTDAGGCGAGRSLKNWADAVAGHSATSAIVQIATVPGSAKLRAPRRAVTHADGGEPVAGCETTVMGAVLNRKHGKFKP